MRLMAKTYVDIMRVHVEIMKSVLATLFVGSVMNTSLMVPTAAENPIPAVKTIQVLQPVALTCTNVISTKETVKITVTVWEFSNVVIAIVGNIFQMGQIVVNNQVPRREVSFFQRIQRFGFCSIIDGNITIIKALYTCSTNHFLIINTGPGLACNGTNFSDLFDCCTEEHQCGLYQGDCTTDSQCKGNLKCGIKNCKLTSNITSYAGHWQEFNCCYNGMSIRKKKCCFVNKYFIRFSV